MGPHPVLSPAFESAYARAADALLVLAAGLVGRADAPDILQEACVIGMRRYTEFSQPGNFEAWMATILRNVARNHRRADRRRSVRLRFWSRMQGDPAPAFGTSPRDGHPIDPALIAAIESLEDDARVCLLLRVVRGMSYQQIADMLSMPDATVRSHVFRARARLAQTLRPEMEVLRG